MAALELGKVVQDVLETSRRYRHIARSVIERMAGEELPKARNHGDAVKRTKRRLHQVFGAYATPLPYAKLLERFKTLPRYPGGGQGGGLKDACRDVLALHASSAERLPELEHFYQRIFEITGRPARILDLACGLNPFTIPWMNLAAGTSYIAADIDLEMVQFVNEFLPMAGVSGAGIVNDLVAGPPDVEADVAFLFKTLPCLQHQTNRLGEVVDRIRARHIICSFPTRSLGNRPKGMVENYRTMFAQVSTGRAWRATEILFDTELVYVVERAT